MKLRYLAFGLLAAAHPAAAQVVINRDGSLPPPSVKPQDYPALVDCTLERRSHDIEAMLAARDKLYEEAFRTQGFSAFPLAYGALVIGTEDGRQVKEAQLFVQIIETCHKLKIGYPLGFWPDDLYRDWERRIASRKGRQR